MSAAVFDENDDRRLCPDESCIGVLNQELVCPECGAIGEAGSDDSSFREPSAVDLLHRSLCFDGSCIGILGADGSCRECGKVGAAVTTDPRLRSFRDLEEASSDLDEDADGASQVVSAGQRDEALEAGPEAEEAVPANGDEPADFARRRLCYDGSCIGIIGSNGTCNECGLVA